MMVYSTRVLRSLMTLALAGSLMIPATSWGQAAKGKRAGEPRTETEIEEITVTAQKREESIQEIPISVTALTGDTLEKKGVVSLSDLTQSVPNLQFLGMPNGAGNIAFSMRGPFQTNPALAQNTTAGLYVDGVYIAKLLGSNMDLEDLDRVEVLRGPQGTLFGRNTISGAIHLVTRKPNEERSITASTEVGNFSAFKGRVTLNVPLIGKNGFFQSDALGTLSLRENAVYRSHEPFIENKSPTSVPASGGAGLNNLNRIFNMTSLRWQPAKDLTVDYSFEYHRYREAPTVQQLTSLIPGSPADGVLNPYVRPNKVDAVGNNAILGNDLTRPPRRLSDDGNNKMHILTVAWDAGEVAPFGSVTLKSISSYRSQFTESSIDFDGSPLHLGEIRRHGNLDTWSEEVQLVGTAPRVNSVLGLYYYGERTTQADELVIFGGGAGGLNTYSFNRNWADSYAAFGQATWTPPILWDKLSLTGGLRYTQDHVHTNRDFRCINAGYGAGGFNICNLPPQLGGPIPGLVDFNASLGKDFGGPGTITFTGDASYQWTDTLMTYFKASQGWQSGFVNAEATDLRLLNIVDPEKLLAYEGGFKSEWFDKRVRLNATGFYSDYTDQVISIFRASKTGGVQGALENAGKSRIYGAEVEATAVPLRGFEVTANYAYLNAKYQEFIEQSFDAQGRPIFDQNGTPVLTNTASTRPFLNIPEDTVSVGITYTAPPMSIGTFSAHIDTYWQNDQSLFSVPIPGRGERVTKGPAYAVVNGQLRLVAIPLQKGSLDIAVFGKNLFDRKYKNYAIDYGDSLGWQIGTFGDPRTFGLRLTYNFSVS